MHTKGTPRPDLGGQEAASQQVNLEELEEISSEWAGPAHGEEKDPFLLAGSLASPHCGHGRGGLNHRVEGGGWDGEKWMESRTFWG